MLPNRHHEHDRKWIAEQLAKLPYDIAIDVCGKYSAVYQHAFDSEPSEQRKDGKARVAANTRLRQFVEKYNSWKSN